MPVDLIFRDPYLNSKNGIQLFLVIISLYSYKKPQFRKSDSNLTVFSNISINNSIYSFLTKTIRDMYVNTCIL